MIDAHTPRKRFGQNFLVDSFIIDSILNAIAANGQQHLVEIGPGQGALTDGLLKSGALLDAIEIDRDLAQLLTNKFAKHKNFTLHCQDVLEFSLTQLVKKDQKLRVVGNLPYNISTPLLFKLFAAINCIDDMYFMLQREVALRLTAQPNCKQYGRLSVMAQYYCDIQIIINVPASAFFPPPKVESCIVRFVPHNNIPTKRNEHLQEIVTAAFNQRRKTIANALKNFFTTAQLLELQIDPQARAENLTLSTFITLANYWESQKK